MQSTSLSRRRCGSSAWLGILPLLVIASVVPACNRSNSSPVATAGNSSSPPVVQEPAADRGSSRPSPATSATATAADPPKSGSSDSTDPAAAPSNPLAPKAAERTTTAQTSGADNREGGTSAASTEAPSASPKGSPESEKSPERNASGDGVAAPDAVAGPEIPGSRERVVLLVPGGPWVVDFLLTIDGKPTQAAAEQLSQELLAAADQDGDGAVTWDELIAKRMSLSLQFGITIPNTDNELRQFIQQRDRNRNKEVDPDEVAALFGTNEMRASGFSVPSFRQRREPLRAVSPIFAVLDTNDDGVLDKDEWAAAVQRLWSRDADDDEQLLPSEFRRTTRAREVLEQQMPRRSIGGAELVWHITEHTDWDGLLIAMQEVYSAGGPLAAESWPSVPRLFAALDVNSNQRLSRAELPGIQKVSPHLVWKTNFGGSGAEPPPLELVGWSDDLGPRDRAQQRQRIWDLPVGEQRIEWSTVAAPQEDPMERAAQLVRTNDTDANGYLSEEEATAAFTANMLLPPFATLDANNDGKLYPEELASVLRRRLLGTRARLQVRVNQPSDPLFDLLDEDHDGRLTGAEIDSAPARFAQLDRDQSGDLTEDEFPTTWSLVVAHGDVAADMRSPRLAGAPAKTDVPFWFQRMDTNQDGVLSRREFIGTSAQFKERDKNEDGILSLDEVVPK